MKAQPNGEMKRHTVSGTPCMCAIAVWALAFAGCARQQQIPIIGPISVPDIGTSDTMEVAEDVLAEMHFEIEKADIPTGYIRTRPLPAAQFFEFWRSDNVGSKNSMLANLHTIRRTVVLDVSDENGLLQIDCHVLVQRLSLPEREVSSSARIYGMHTRSSPTLQKLSFDFGQTRDAAWISLDDDKELAAEILRRIAERIDRLASQPPEASEKRT